MGVLHNLGETKPPKKSYKDIHGTTRVGDFLRSIGKADVLGKIVNVAGELITGDVGGVIDVLTKTKELNPEQKDYALKLAEMDLQELSEITKRWERDMISDSWLSKNTRPLTLIFLTIMMTLFITLDSSNIPFDVDEAWVDLLKTLLLTVYIAYFGSRGIEKYKKMSIK